MQNSFMASDEWFKTWFDNSLYEQLYAYRDDSEAESLVSWLAKYYPPETYTRVLDMGCGRGRHSLVLANHGYKVTGVDLSPTAIEKAQEKAKKAGISGIVFKTGDMRIYRDGPFDLVCNLFTSFGYFESDEENIRVIENMVRQIREGGYLIMDYINSAWVENNLVDKETVRIGDMCCNITRKMEGDTIVKSISFYTREGNKVSDFQERVKSYDKNWFTKTFKKLELENLMFYGDYDGKTFYPEKSPRLIMMARKKQGF